MALFSQLFEALVAVCALAAFASPVSAGNADLTTSRDEATIPSFRLNVYNPKIQTFAAEFLTESGRVTIAPKTANVFKVSNYGGLATADEGRVTVYLSGSRTVKSMPWGMSPALQSIYFGFNLTSTEHGQVLTWENEAFDNRRARFCQHGSQIVIVFKGKVPTNCSVVDLLAYRDK